MSKLRSYERDFPEVLAKIKNAEDMIRLHQDPAMTEQKAARWIKQKCVPNEKVRAAMESISL